MAIALITFLSSKTIPHSKITSDPKGVKPNVPHRAAIRIKEGYTARQEMLAMMSKVMIMDGS